ncbi:hypothetical protein FZEAL_8015 [Fusarium zealandicum]|uniref:Alpha-1,3-mannosyltransferase n=1 Tax=Fusarium zealandicum TaxID=1053134 RepID=A0A8H4UFA5_9HYPO|nr:hypothetical protein FZEAL_8015 [Fusarium zealandicum]
MARMPAYLRFSEKSILITAAIAFFWLFVVFAFRYRDPSFFSPSIDIQHNSSALPGRPDAPSLHDLEPIKLGAQYFLDYPLHESYKDIFGELGQRAQLLRSWIQELEGHVQSPAQDESREQREETAELVEQVVESLFPYLNPKQGLSPPLAEIYNRLAISYNDTSTSNPAKAPAGIVIPTGEKTLRFACHLIAALTSIHKTELPIQVVYAGDNDLSPVGRETIQAASSGVEIEMLDILTVFDDSTLDLAKGGWAIKPFAALASRFEKVILLDADAVFIQDPQQLLRQDQFLETGALLFHDRLLWKGGFPDRHNWWHEQLKHPSKETDKSLVWTERYSEEGDSGIVVLDKSRLDVLIGLLHIGWQNSEKVRNEVTYKITYGDKESWWIGFEATGSTYSFSPHYGGIVGWLGPTKAEIKKAEEEKKKMEEEQLDKEKEVESHDNETAEAKAAEEAKKSEQDETQTEDGKTKRDDTPNEKHEREEIRVCSFVIAHVDQTDKLLWYNGGLLKNKAVNQTEFEVPTHWMIDQKWHKGASKKDMSCMAGFDASELSEGERDVLKRSIEVAREVDKRLSLVPVS